MKKYINGKILLFGGIAILGFYFGACSINHGLPYPYDNDGLNYVQQALKHGSGVLRPFGLKHGTLLPYILLFEYAVYFLMNLLIGRMAQPVDLLKAYILDPSIFFILGRLTVVFFSMGCLFLIYLICRKFIDEKTGLIAALFTSVSFNMVYMSHSLTAHIMVVFFILWSFYFALEALECKHHFKQLYISALLVGLATSTVLYGVIGISIIFAVLAIKIKNKEITPPIFLKTFLKCIFITTFIFLILNPYLLIDLKKFIHQFFEMKQNMFSTWDSNAAPSTWRSLSNTWQYPFFLRQGVGSPIYYLYIVSLFAIFFNRNILLCNIFPILLFIFFCFFKKVAPWYVPAFIPFVSISSAFLITRAADFFFKKKNLRIAVTFLAAILFSLSSFIVTWKYCRLLDGEDTRALAKEWIETNIKRDSSILVEGAYDFNIVAGGPPLRENISTLKKELNEIKQKGGLGFMWEHKIMYADIPKTPAYELYKTGAVSREDIKKYDPEYIILSNYIDPSMFSEYNLSRDFLNLKESYICIKKVIPDVCIRFFPCFDSLLYGSYEKIRDVDMKLLRTQHTYGPVIEIYKRSR